MAYPNNNKPKIKGHEQVFYEEVLHNAQRALNDNDLAYIVRDVNVNRFYISEFFDSKLQLDNRIMWLQQTIARISRSESPREPGWDFAWAAYAEVLNGTKGSFADEVAKRGHEATISIPREPNEDEQRILDSMKDHCGKSLDEYNAQQERIAAVDRKPTIPTPTKFSNIEGFADRKVGLGLG